jgi:hypothetical protein
VLQHLHPIDEKNGFTSEIFMSEVSPEHVRPVRNVLTAGSSLRVVQRDRTDRDRYYLHGELYKTLARIRARSLMTAAHAPQDRIAYGGPLDARQPAIADQRAGRLLANGHAHNGASHADDEELRAQFREALLKALNLGPASLEKISDRDIAGEVMLAANTLKKQATRVHHSLGGMLKLIESESNRVLDEACRALAIRCEGDKRATQLLNETAGELRQLMPALMLLPEGGLVEQLIAGLEEAANEQDLSSQEHLLLNKLRKLKEDLGAMDQSDLVAWKRVARQIERIGEPSTVVAMGSGTTRH